DSGYTFIDNITFNKANTVETPTAQFQTEQNDVPTYGSVTKNGLETAVGAIYTDKLGIQYVVDSTGLLTMHNDTTDLFKDQFRIGSYIYLEEDADPNYYTTTWKLTDKGTVYANGNGTVINDSRSEESGYASPLNYNSNVQRPEHALLYRSTVTDDITTPTNIAATYTNTVNTGSIKITKEVGEGNLPENTEYTFTIKFENLFGQIALGENPITDTFTLKAGESKEYTGIPVGTNYVITEASGGDSYAVSNITKKGNDTGAADVAKQTFSGSVSLGATDTQDVITFTNAQKPVEVNKTFYVEAGKTTELQVANDTITSVDDTAMPSDSENHAPVLLTKTEGGKVSFDTAESKQSVVNEEYTFSYTGKDTEKGLVAGTAKVYTFKANNDIYVFDYGLKSSLSDNTSGCGLFANDVLFNDKAAGTSAKLNGLAKTETESWTGSVTLDQSKVTCTPGTALNRNENENGAYVADDDSKGVWWEPTAFLDQKETSYYQTWVLASGKTAIASPEDGVALNASITTMPADVVYYEDNFAGQITYTGDDRTVIVNSTPLTLTQSNDQNELYGFDNAYANSENNDSAGGSTAMKVGAKATFKFKGTGFDLIARTAQNTGAIVYKVKDIDANSVKYYGAVDTYYNNGDLYQLPVLSLKDMGYSTYEVTILVVESEMDGANTFYLDGVRIYDPAGDTLDEHYLSTEAGADIKNIRQMILGDCEITENGVTYADGSTSITSAEVPGSSASVLYYDGTDLYFWGETNQEDIASSGATYGASLADYLRRGPSNEVYLGGDSGVGFIVKPDDSEANPTFQIEAKSVDISTAGSGSNSNLYMLNSDNGKASIASVETKTAMYYDIPVDQGIPLEGGYYLIVVTGDNSDNTCISLTNLKTKGYVISSPADSANASLVKDVISQNTVEDVDYAVDTQFVKYTSAPSKGKKAKAVLKVPENAVLDGFQVYGNDNPITTTTNNYTAMSESGYKFYEVSFNMPNAKGTYALKFVAYKLENDVKTESATYLEKSVTIRR
ncbi:MAG: hypothetical protein ACI4TD_02755, partial [Phocaeicola sp.]